jgi:hypothetical protein
MIVGDMVLRLQERVIVGEESFVFSLAMIGECRIRREKRYSASQSTIPRYKSKNYFDSGGQCGQLEKKGKRNFPNAQSNRIFKQE